MRAMIGSVMVVALSTAASARFARKTQDYTFDYAYPAAAARIAPLRAWLNADAARLRSELVRDVASAKADSRKGGFAFRPYNAERTWSVVTDTPRFLSLSSALSSYSGGAHGSFNTTALLWDKKAVRRIETKSVFLSPAALQAALGAKWCAWLRKERSERIGSDATKDTFFKCPPVKDLTLLLGSSDRRHIDRIGLIADQYVAGSYAEGPYETTLPVTAAALAAVAPMYRGDFAIR